MGFPTPEDIKGGGPRFKSVARHQILSNFCLWGDKWISEFIYGFATTGAFSQTWVFPRSDKAKMPPPLSVMWKTRLTRFKTRARASGFKNAEVLWQEALNRPKEGWLSEPLEFSADGDTPFTP